ncbi:MAG: metallophosphoesterase [Acidobacteria bacterium]|nr:metallophosphoesterase [Acidobacteriota bacterium]MCL5286569.1 metallophosphoesterase [Acidobacteriota bacterium]
METAQFILRGLLLLAVLAMLFFSQRYWFRQAKRLKQRISHKGLRLALRYLLIGLAVFVFALTASYFTGGPLRRLSVFPMLGLWLFSSLFAWLGIKVVKAAERIWDLVRKRSATERKPRSAVQSPPSRVENPSRRQFFQTATYFAGAAPFVGAVYGFAAERLRFTLERVEVPLGNLPEALDGLRIAQISDIHMSAFMTREQLRRAVDMANELGAELAVVTGDFITGRNDPLEDCAAELAALHAPLGVWGCLGNHEIYADCEDRATELMRQAGLRVLRRENAEIVWRGQPLNLIGVDYQRTRGLDGRKLPMLSGVEPLVRRDVPNILLSHNPNAFDRAAELGIEFTLAGHTHGGQINVEILESQINAARFMTDYVAGIYSQSSQVTAQTAHLYVNRGLGTVGAPVRVGAPPEITLFTFRRA